jgi:hypothetical protein
MSKLTELECKDFMYTHLGLLFFAGKKLKLLSNHISYDAFLNCDIQLKFNCRQSVIENKNIIEDYIQLYANKLTQDKVEILAGFKKQITNRFIIYKCLSDCAIFIDANHNKFYAVKALTDPFESFFDQFPVIIKTTILPFKDKIIYDGFFESPIMYVGSNMTKVLTKDYKNAVKQKNVLLTIQ